MKITIEFDTGNAAFEGGNGERRRILTEVVRKISEGQTDFKIMDFNGNTVGKCEVQS